MFGKKEKSLLKPINGYSQEIINIISNHINGVINADTKDVDFDKIVEISIDNITVKVPYGKKFPVEMHLQEGVTTEYIKAWKKGIGRFIIKDLNHYFKGVEGASENIKKYKLLKLENGMYAFIRFITESDGIKDTDVLDDMVKYNAISFPCVNDMNGETYCLVMKVFKTTKYIEEGNIEQLLRSKTSINKIKEDFAQFSLFTVFEGTEKEDSEKEIEELEKTSKSKIENEEYSAEEELF